MMLNCWNHSPDIRPSFSQLVIQLEELLQSSQEYLDISTQVEPIITYQSDQYLVPNPGPDKSGAKDLSCFVGCAENLSSRSEMRGKGEEGGDSEDTQEYMINNIQSS